MTSLEDKDNPKDATVDDDANDDEGQMKTIPPDSLDSIPWCRDELSHTDDGQGRLTDEPQMSRDCEGPTRLMDSRWDKPRPRIQGLRGEEPRWTVQQRSEESRDPGQGDDLVQDDHRLEDQDSVHPAGVGSVALCSAAKAPDLSRFCLRQTEDSDR